MIEKGGNGDSAGQATMDLQVMGDCWQRLEAADPNLFLRWKPVVGL